MVKKNSGFKDRLGIEAEFYPKRVKHIDTKQATIVRRFPSDVYRENYVIKMVTKYGCSTPHPT